MIATRQMLKQDQDEPEIGSIVRIKTDPVQIGEIANYVHGRKEWFEVIIYDKRLKPIQRSDGSYKVKKHLVTKCKLLDENFIYKHRTFEIGDILCKETSTGRKKYGVIVGFTHPDGLLSHSYANGYNGTDLIDCVEIEKRGLRRKRNDDDSLKRFSTFKHGCIGCEIDLWHKTGPKIINT